MSEHRAYAYQLSFWHENDGPRPLDSVCAIGGMDGSWWVDWPQLEKMAAHPLPSDPGDVANYLMPLVLVAGRGKLTEVTRERADEIALEYGERLASEMRTRGTVA